MIFRPFSVLEEVKLERLQQTTVSSGGCRILLGGVKDKECARIFEVTPILRRPRPFTIENGVF